MRHRWPDVNFTGPFVGAMINEFERDSNRPWKADEQQKFLIANDCWLQRDNPLALTTRHSDQIGDYVH